MRVTKEIYDAVKTYLDIEVQSGRRHSPLDAQVVSEFIATTRAEKKATPSSLSSAAAPVAPAPAAAPAAMPAQRPLASSIATPVNVKTEAPKPCTTIAELTQQIPVCKGCAFCATRTNAIAGSGNVLSPDILFVGEVPDAEEDARGVPFAGQAGELLAKMIQAMGYRLEDVYITNVVKCFTPNEPSIAAMQPCFSILKQQIQILKPKVIVTLGTTPFQLLSGKTQVSLTNCRGKWLSYEGIPFMPTFHPSYLLRVPDAKRGVWTDLKKVLTQLGREVPPTKKA